MSKRGDVPQSVLYLLVALLVLSLAIQTVVFVSIKYQSPLEPITGEATGQVFLTIAGLCTGPIVEGWNLISFCASLVNTSVDAAFQGIDFRFVMRWNETTQEFMIFSPLAAVNPFTEIEVNQSYFLYLNSLTDEVSPSGTLFGDVNVSLVEGWDTPAYPYEFDSNFTFYFNGSVHRFHMKWNTSNQEFIIFSPRSANPPGQIMNVGDGQFILSITGNTIKYNRSNLSG